MEIKTILPDEHELGPFNIKYNTVWDDEDKRYLTKVSIPISTGIIVHEAPLPIEEEIIEFVKNSDQFKEGRDFCNGE